MPFNNYAPQYIFKGQVQSDTAPSANNDLVRKQDVSGLSFITSIASGSSPYLSVDGSGELSVSSLLISDVHVDNSQTSLANFISNESSTAASLKKGDFLVLTAATGGAETYIVSGADGSVAGNYTQVESGLTSAEIVAKLSAGAGISTSAGGTTVTIAGTDASTSGVAIRRGSNDAQAAFLVMSKSRNASVGSRTILQNGDEVGNIFFAADDGTDLVSNTAAIKSQVDGAPGANDTPGNLSFWTTADGANTAVQRMTIDSNGHVTKPYQFHIEVDRDSDQTGYNAAANFGTPMIFNRVVRTIGTQNSALDTSTGKITVPVAGVYFLEAAVVASADSFQQAWFTEGTSRMNYSDHVHAGETSAYNNRTQVTGMHYLSANTEVGFKPYGNGQSNVTIGDSVYHTWMRVTLIG